MSLNKVKESLSIVSPASVYLLAFLKRGWTYFLEVLETREDSEIEWMKKKREINSMRILNLDLLIQQKNQQSAKGSLYEALVYIFAEDENFQSF